MSGHSLLALAANRALVAALAALASSQLLKVLAPVARFRLPDLRRITDYGGFPSAHSAFISACAAEIGFQEGFDSGLFALATVTAAIVISDIIRLRSTVERSKADIEVLLEHNGLSKTGKRPQFRSHSLGEVLAGIAWGCICGYAIWLFRL